jgi:hypothetical protein
MYSLRGRLLYGAAALLVAAWLISTGHGWGWALLALPVLLAWGFFRYGPMVVAFRAYHDQDWEMLALHLRTVRRPSLLSAQNRAYFTFLSGVAAFRAGDVPRASALLAAVPVEQLRTDNMRAILECHRAEVALAANDPADAHQHLDRARALPHKPEVDQVIATIERDLAAR